MFVQANKQIIKPNMFINQIYHFSNSICAELNLEDALVEIKKPTPPTDFGSTESSEYNNLPSDFDFSETSNVFDRLTKDSKFDSQVSAENFFDFDELSFDEVLPNCNIREKIIQTAKSIKSLLRKVLDYADFNKKLETLKNKATAKINGIKDKLSKLHPHKFKESASESIRKLFDLSYSEVSTTAINNDKDLLEDLKELKEIEKTLHSHTLRPRKNAANPPVISEIFSKTTNPLRRSERIANRKNKKDANRKNRK